MSGPATWPYAPISASQRSPWRSAHSRLITTTAAAPSEIGEAEPAVMVPSALNAGRSRDSDSTVVSGRMPSSSVTRIGSPFRCGTATGTISSSKVPSFCARAARWCDCAAKASCSSRVSPCRALWRSVDSPIEIDSKASVRPSGAMASSTSNDP